MKLTCEITQSEVAGYTHAHLIIENEVDVKVDFPDFMLENYLGMLSHTILKQWRKQGETNAPARSH